MKKYAIYPILCLCLSWLWTSCSDSEEVFNDTLTPSENSAAAFSQGLAFEDGTSTQTLSFEAGNAWTATVSGTEASAWCRVSPAQGKAGQNTVSVSVEKNGAEEARSAQLTFTVGSLNRQVSITQAAKPYTIPEGLSWTPEKPDADEPLTIHFRADGKSALNGYTGDVYVHIGIVSEGDWQYVPAAWDENKDQCKMKADAANVWSITLSPSVRQWFGSGETPVKKLGIVIRSADGTKKGIEEDSFIGVTDTKHQGFVPGETIHGTMPSGMKEGINVHNTKNAATFVLYDKDKNGESKDYAYIVGDFNNWTLANDETSRMTRDDAAGCWWITVNGLEANRQYAFQYYLGDNDGEPVRIGDPYCEKVWDPNDQYLPEWAEKKYPEGAKGIVSVFQTYDDPYTWSDFTLTDPDKLVIYELLVRDFTPDGSIDAVKQELPYLKELGINAIELMPVQEFQGNDSWGYNPSFFFALDKAYGRKQNYKDFIDACHKEGIAVILDVVYNHATDDFPHAKLYFDEAKNKTAANNPFFNVDAPHPYSVCHDFNHENEWVRAYVKRNLQFLLEEYNLDGFRFDLTKGFTQKKSTESNASNYDASRIAILKDYHAAIREVKPDAFVIIEHFCDPKEEQELAGVGMHPWRNLNHAFCQTAMGYEEDSDFSGMFDNGWVTFMESHDEERMGYKQTQWGFGALKTDLATRMKQLEVNAAFALAAPGAKMIWQFGEMGYDYSINSDPSGNSVDESYRTGRKPIRWDYLEDPHRKALHDTYARLLKLRNEHPELFDHSAGCRLVQANWENGRSLHRTSVTGKELVVLGNFTDKETIVSFPATTGEWTEWLSGEKQQVGASMKVPAHSFVIYTRF